MFVTVQRRHARPTHFVSLALQSDELLENYNTFRTMVKNSSAVPVSILEKQEVHFVAG
jgi:hypothetical protein